ncbi:amidoligase family protein [Marinospirillum perlucidum]|uniref:amidoligase family protein n=1 Tax=Marinospirillum perlucidum TaxID=1982602 RepID=UPI000DF3FAF5|nr:amidoligase family protein [Marinospirillum perlucidum]
MNPNQQLLDPPWQTNPQGQERHIGVEIEMTGLTLDALAQHTAHQLDGQISTKGRYERQITDSHQSEWLIELDFHLLKEMGREEHVRDTFSGEVGKSVEEALAWFAENLVPLEVVSPPLPLSRLQEVEQLIARLHQAGAKGSSDSLINAFGLQLNPEIPDTDARILTSLIKAFLCLYEWLHARARIDLSRQVTSYINPFPTSYVKKVLDQHYWPPLEQLIDDYLYDNPTRNRPLDCLPLFLHLDAPRVRKITEDPLIKPRPTFHYRLPSSEIHRPDWGLYQAWNDWIQVERLAADTERLDACCQAYLKYLNKPLDRLIGNWTQELEKRWLDL